MDIPKSWKKRKILLLTMTMGALVLMTTACGRKPTTMKKINGKSISEDEIPNEAKKVIYPKTDQESRSLNDSGASGRKGSDADSPVEEIIETPEPTKAPSLRSLYQNAASGTLVDVSGRSKKEIKTLFYAQKIKNSIFQNMKGKSYHTDCPVKRSQLRHVRVIYVGFDKKPHIGELIVNQSIAREVVEIFYKLYRKRYQIEKMELIDVYGGDDDESMADNNTSCFNYRPVKGTTHLSRHSYGLAIDINPKYNPYIHVLNGKTVCEPPNGAKYADRRKSFPHKIDSKDLCYKLFVAKGYTWGGNWRSVKDYQHFQK